METGTDTLRTAALTLLALVAFAANSVLCRLALGGGAIDAAGFTLIRLAAGAAVLFLLCRWRSRERPKGEGDWGGAGWLFLYAAAFSFAYLSLAAGTGALILFGAVQATMVLSGLRSGERPGPGEWLGLILALGGLAYLVRPGLAAPDPAGSILMAAAGVAWGRYSLRGRGGGDPLRTTAGNFLRALPLAAVLGLLFLPRLRFSLEGALLAAVSGGLASGVGYVLWYGALRGLAATLAATTQLAVPVLAALGGVVFLAEPVSLRLLLASVFILGGVALTVASRGRRDGRTIKPPNQTETT